jgi:hypothetical protein
MPQEMLNMHRFNWRELREWMGMTRADGCVYLALLACIALFVGQDWWGDALLSLGAVGLCTGACVLGMKSDPEFEDITNLFKALCYPTAMLFVLGVITVHYLLLIAGHADAAGQGYAHAVESIDDFIRTAINGL